MRAEQLLTMLLNRPGIVWSKYRFIKFARDTLAQNWVNSNLKSGFYRDNLIFACCMSKAGSCNLNPILEGTLKGRLPFKRFYRQTFPRWMEEDWHLRPELIHDFPFGGVLAYHIPPTYSNLKIIHNLQSKYIILLRHPADQMVGFYNWRLEEPFDYTFANSWVGAFPSEVFFQDMEKVFDYLIRGGYLSDTINWMTNWLLLRNPERSLVIRFEDLVTDLRKFINTISNFLIGQDAPEPLIEKVRDFGQKHTKKNYESAPAYKYIKGYTGKIGVWKDYFSEQNKRSYLEMIEVKFKGSYGKLLKEFYKDYWPLP